MITIRKSTYDDYASVAKLHQEIMDIHADGASWNFEKITPSYRLEFFTERLEDIDTHFLLAVDGKDVCLGYAIYQIKHSDDFPILKKRKWLFLKDIIITEKMKGKGIGTLFIEAGEQLGKELGIDSIELSVWSFNEEAIEFYRKKGFETFSLKMRKEL